MYAKSTNLLNECQVLRVLKSFFKIIKSTILNQLTKYAYEAMNTNFMVRQRSLSALYSLKYESKHYDTSKVQKTSY